MGRTQSRSLVSSLKIRFDELLRIILLIVTLIGAYISDRYDARGIPIMVISTLAVAGFALFLSTFLAVCISILPSIIDHVSLQSRRT